MIEQQEFAGQLGIAAPLEHPCSESSGGTSLCQVDRLSCMQSYFNVYRNNALLELMKRHHGAFMLLFLIAFRARRTDAFNEHGLEINQAFIGDFKEFKLTGQKYRTAKLILEKCGFATFRTTNRGTIATLTASELYDINSESTNRLANSQVTDSQQ